jgi:hypothetical protein
MIARKAAASVTSPMRRLVLLVLLAPLVLAPAARADSVNQIIRDCADDGVLQGHYAAADLRKALRHLPTDVAEYSTCTDVLSRALAAAASQRTPPSGGGGGSGGQPASPVASATPSGEDTGNVRPANPQDTQALATAAHSQPPAGVVKGRANGVGLTAAVGRNSLPSSVLVLLILLGAACLAAVAPGIRRVLARLRR